MEIIPAYGYIGELLELVKEYTDSILEEDEEVAKCLKSQHLSDELSDIEKKYALPDGRLYIAFIGGKAAGCIGLTKNNAEYCEMKRLYVRPEFRKCGAGAALTEKAIEDAALIGYKHIRLDTFKFMTTAIEMYRKYGFYEIERYNDNPAENVLYMQKDL